MKLNTECFDLLACYAEPAGEIRTDVSVERTLSPFSVDQSSRVPALFWTT